ncbi:UDP-glycosyltransferase 83A1-like [Euphorbia lathyris]|uniref:UDP-glycosyltransferase 83A1-like n=1 Tax=Euphorbia lathyris TaxID=212925 RepID=UPI0033130BCB
MARKPHLILIPLAAQGHVAPMMKLAYNLVHHGIKVTFVNTLSMHEKIMSALPQKLEEVHSLLSLVSIPELLKSDTPGKDRMDEVAENASRFLQTQLQNLIQNINEDGHEVTHVIGDVTISWALKVANQMGIKAVGFVPYGLANFSLVLHIHKLIENGIIDVNGMLKEGSICLSKEIPAWDTQNLLWRYPYDGELQKFLFRHFFYNAPEDVKCCNTILANSFYELETAACNLIPNILPIGPLFSRYFLGAFAGNMWAEDSSCLSWLDQQSSGSVIYAAFGSSVFCSQEQFNELAIAFEMTGRPFLWVVRSDFSEGIAAKFPQGFNSGNHGKIVEWAPQEKVLAHPSIGCFFSHSGWNSTMEGVSKGVPFLCWPYLADQFRNQDDICNTWRIGLKVIPDENGIVTRHEIKSKIEKLLGDENIKANSLKLKELAVENMREEGSSFMNFKSFIDQIQIQQ